MRRRVIVLSRRRLRTLKVRFRGGEEREFSRRNNEPIQAFVARVDENVPHEVCLEMSTDTSDRVVVKESDADRQGPVAKARFKHPTLNREDVGSNPTRLALNADGCTSTLLEGESNMEEYVADVMKDSTGEKIGRATDREWTRYKEIVEEDDPPPYNSQHPVFGPDIKEDWQTDIWMCHDEEGLFQP